MAIIIAGIDVTYAVYLIAISGALFLLALAYQNGDLQKWLGQLSGKKEVDYNEDDTSDLLELEDLPMDIKLHDIDNEEYYDYMGFRVENESKDIMTGSFLVSQGNVEQPEIDGKTDQGYVKLNKSFLKGRQATIIFSRKGTQGIVSKENADLRKRISSLEMENQRVNSEMEAMQVTSSERVKKLNESVGARRRSYTKEAGKFSGRYNTNKSSKENDEYDEEPEEDEAND